MEWKIIKGEDLNEKFKRIDRFVQDKFEEKRSKRKFSS